MSFEGFAKKLKALQHYDIIFTRHARLRLIQRQIKKKLVITHLRNPTYLILVEKRETKKEDEKYKLWFVPSKRIAYIYIIVINHTLRRIIVKTAIKQRLMWQKRVERHVK